MMSTPGIFVFIIFIKIKLKYVVCVRKRTMRVNVNYVKLNVNYSLIFDDNRNNLRQLHVRKRTIGEQQISKIASPYLVFFSEKLTSLINEFIILCEINFYKFRIHKCIEQSSFVYVIPYFFFQVIIV